MASDPQLLRELLEKGDPQSWRLLADLIHSQPKPPYAAYNDAVIVFEADPTADSALFVARICLERGDTTAATTYGLKALDLFTGDDDQEIQLFLEALITSIRRSYHSKYKQDAQLQTLARHHLRGECDEPNYFKAHKAIDEKLLATLEATECGRQLKQHNQEIQTLIAGICEHSVAKLDEPPCGFSVVMLGSHGREEACLFSDVEYLILTEEMLIRGSKADIYFSHLHQLIEHYIQRAGFDVDATIIPYKLQNLPAQRGVKAYQAVFAGTPKDLARKLFHPMMNALPESPNNATAVLGRRVIYSHGEKNRLAQDFDSAIARVLGEQCPLRPEGFNHRQHFMLYILRDAMHGYSPYEQHEDLNVKNHLLRFMDFSIMAMTRYLNKHSRRDGTVAGNMVEQLRLLGLHYDIRGVLSECHDWALFLRLQSHETAGKEEDILDIHTIDSERLLIFKQGVLQPLYNIVFQFYQHEVFKQIRQYEAADGDTLSRIQQWLENLESLCPPNFDKAIYTSLLAHWKASLFSAFWHELESMSVPLPIELISHAKYWPGMAKYFDYSYEKKPDIRYRRRALECDAHHWGHAQSVLCHALIGRPSELNVFEHLQQVLATLGARQLWLKQAVLLEWYRALLNHQRQDTDWLDFKPEITVDNFEAQGPQAQLPFFYNVSAWLVQMKAGKSELKCPDTRQSVSLEALNAHPDCRDALFLLACREKTIQPQLLALIDPSPKASKSFSRSAPSVPLLVRPLKGERKEIGLHVSAPPGVLPRLAKRRNPEPEGRAQDDSAGMSPGF